MLTLIQHLLTAVLTAVTGTFTAAFHFLTGHPVVLVVALLFAVTATTATLIRDRRTTNGA